MRTRPLSCAVALLFLCFALPAARAQDAVPADAAAARLDAMSRLLTETQRQLEQTQQQLNALRLELEALRGKPQGAPVANAPLAEQVAHQQEEQEVLQAEVKQHEQSKVESMSKYPVRIYGLLLFNAFSNAGVVDNASLPSAAIAGAPDASHGSVGGDFRQTLFGVNASGPRLFGARTSGDVSIDFNANPTYNYYSSSNGNLRLRRADIGLVWERKGNPEIGRDEVHAGIDAPLISPLSPTSFATVAMPSLAWSGNLWTWAPQLQYRHYVALGSSHPTRSIELEGGLWDPPAVGVSGSTSSPILSAGEISRRPGFLGRASFHAGSPDHPFIIGAGGYSDRQTFYEGQQIQMWAVTSDWQIPITHRFQLSGEFYRGRGLGGLGGGAYKDTLTGLDVITGASRTLGLNAVGGWAQVKATLFHGAEANLIFGQDGAFASDFHQLNLTGSTYVLEQSARTQMTVANLIYRPKTYLILSPEYRRILSWKITGPAAIANVYTLSLGYQF